VSLSTWMRWQPSRLLALPRVENMSSEWLPRQAGQLALPLLDAVIMRKHQQQLTVARCHSLDAGRGTTSASGNTEHHNNTTTPQYQPRYTHMSHDRPVPTLHPFANVTRSWGRIAPINPRRPIRASILCVLLTVTTWKLPTRRSVPAPACHGFARRLDRPLLYVIDGPLTECGC
jgi:hypothetical protein